MTNRNRMIIIDVDFDRNGSGTTVMVLPDESYYHYPSSIRTSYQSIGQHCGFSLDWFKEESLIQTTSEESRNDMLDELKSIGYDLGSYVLITNRSEVLRLDL